MVGVGQNSGLLRNPRRLRLDRTDTSRSLVVPEREDPSGEKGPFFFVFRKGWDLLLGKVGR